MTSAKSLTKTAVLDASDDPKDQDKARERRVKMDFASWRKQTKAGKKTHQEEVGISSAVAMKKAREEAKRKLIQDKAVAKQKAAFGDSDKQVKEAKADTGSATEKATARNKRNTPAGKDYDFDNKVLKITGDMAEAEACSIIVGKYHPNVYDSDGEEPHYIWKE